MGSHCVRDTRYPHSINVKDESVVQKSMCRLVLPFSFPQSYDLPISRMKRGGVAYIMASCIILASLVWSVPLPQEHQWWLPHTPDPSTSIISPLIQQGCSGERLKDSTKLPVHPTKRSLNCLLLGQWQVSCTLWYFLTLTPFWSLFL